VIVGIMKVYNEIELISDTLEHLSGLCDHMVVWDDVSDDGTRDVIEEWAQTHKNLIAMFPERQHHSRVEAQGGTLQLLLEQAMTMAPDWILNIDADERVEMPVEPLKDYDAVRMRLFDFYITPHDETLEYHQRQWMGPEYRNILMMYRPFAGMHYGWLDQREMWGLPRYFRTLNSGFVRHYGKAISVERWERKCDFYATHFPEPYRTKWERRRGKAIKHDMKSDFGRPLIQWKDRFTKGMVL
jgi:glycosyltransferase involved in cell wall biosynthesis